VLERLTPPAAIHSCRLQAQLDAATAKLEQQSAAATQAVAEECERHLAAERAMQLKMQQLASELAVAQVCASKPRQPKPLQGQLVVSPRHRNFHLPFSVLIITVRRRRCALLQAAAASAGAQVSSLEAAVQKGSQVTLSMTEKVAHSLAAANAQANNLKVRLCTRRNELYVMRA
jgi:hypothetical protein